MREKIASRAAGLGYSISYRVHLATDFGVPERRERVMFVGVRADVGDAEAVCSILPRYRADPPCLRSVLQGCGRYGSDANPRTCTSKVTLAANPVMRRSPYAGMLVNGAGRPIDLDSAAPTLPATMGGNKTPIVDQRSLEDASAENWFAGYHRRLLDGSTAPATETVPPFVRRLTIAEAAAIQTFPPGYVFCGSASKRYRQIGNAVPCALAEAVAKTVRDAYLS